MSWWSGGGGGRRASETQPPARSDRDTLRAQHIESLVRTNPHAQPRNPEKSVFELGLKLANGQVIALRIIMGARFPEEAPTLQLMTNCQHPWISTDGYCRVIGHINLNQWTPRSDLGRIVSEVVQEFCRNPPRPLGPQQGPQGATQPGVGAPGPQQGGQPPTQQQPQQPQQPQYPGQQQGGLPPQQPQYPGQLGGQPQYPGSQAPGGAPPGYPGQQPQPGGGGPPTYESKMPGVGVGVGGGSNMVVGGGGVGGAAGAGAAGGGAGPPGGVPHMRQQSSDLFQIPNIPRSALEEELRKEDLKSLQGLKEDDNALDDFFCEMGVHKNATEFVDMYKGVAVQQAKGNVDKHERAVHEKVNAIEILYSTLREKKAAYDGLILRHAAIMQRYTPQAIAAKMAAHVDKMENGSEDIAEDFMSGEKDVDGFLKEYIPQRTKYHKLNAMLERYRSISN